MPGICGIVTGTAAEARSLVGAMASRQQHYPWQKSHTWVSGDGHVGLATVTLDSQDGAGIAELYDVALAFDGELYAAKETRAHLVQARGAFHRRLDTRAADARPLQGGPAVSGIAPRMLCRRDVGPAAAAADAHQRPVWHAAALLGAGEWRPGLCVRDQGAARRAGPEPHDVGATGSLSSSRLASISATGRRLTRSRCCPPRRSSSSIWRRAAAGSVVRRRRAGAGSAGNAGGHT